MGMPSSVAAVHGSILADARADYHRHAARADWHDLRVTIDDEASASLRFYVPNPFTDRHNLRAGEAARREGEAGAELFYQQTERTIYELKREIAAGERTLAVLLEREKNLDEWVAHVKRQQDARVATQADVLALELQRLRLRSTIGQTRFASQSARRTLASLATDTLHTDTNLNVSAESWEPLIPAALELIGHMSNTWVSHSPELVAARHACDKAESLLAAARAAYVPWISHVQAGFAPARDGIRNEDEWSARVAVNIPVFAWIDSSKVKMAMAELDAANFREAAVRQRLRDEFAAALAEYRELTAMINDYRAAYDATPAPTPETVPDPETRFKLADARLAAYEHLIGLELRRVLVYGRMIHRR